MRLHRLVLTNYRGIAHRDLEFPDHGVVVVCGANEIGKSSMIEALDLLLESKDRSTKKEVKQVKPTHSDVGSEVSADISCGPYRFVYRKRFHKKCETELTVLAPRREQLTGDEAHERVRAMLAETVDNDLWHAQRILQSTSTAAVDLSGCDSLSRALDVAAGAHGGGESELSGTESLLIERIDAEYGRYVTPSGRPTGEWSAATSRYDAARAAVDGCAAKLAEVDDLVARHAALTERVAELSQRRIDAGPRLVAARAAADKVADLTRQAHDAGLLATAATAQSTAATAAHTGRQRLRADLDTRTGKVTAAEAEAHHAAEVLLAVRAEADAAEAAATQAAAHLAERQQRVTSARRTVDRLTERAEADRLRSRLAGIDAASTDIDGVSAQLAQPPVAAVTEELMRRIEEAATAVDRIGDQLASTSAAVEFTASADLKLAAADQQVTLAAGQTWSTTATGPTTVEVPGVLTVRVSPGAATLDVQARHAAAQQDLADALRAAGVADIAAARVAAERRRELTSARAQLTATLKGLCGDDDVDELRARLAQLSADPDAEPALDAAAARADLEAAEEACVAAATDCETRRAESVTAAGRLAESSTTATVLQSKLEAERAELDAATERLTQERATATDDELAAAAETGLQAARDAERRVAELAEQLAAAAPDAVAAELAAATDEADALRISHDEAVLALRDIATQLEILGGEGRRSKLDDAQSELEDAAGQHERIGRRVRAASLLRSVMARHRDATRLRYVEPYRAELHRLGRPVFGDTFEVDVDTDLRIRSRTLDGVTVPYESLSGGAKEQLGILARLAGAALVAKEDTVPVVIDDALGFTDPDRLARMGEVFDMMGTRGQVIVLTCSPGRYDGVKGAHRIDLSA
jgi:uncharacterized protein YhaN